MRPLAYTIAMVAVAALSASSAVASQSFPLVVKSTLGLAKAPDCILCHESEKGGENTANQPFGRTMQRFGAVKKNDQSLVLALQRADAEGTDSDGDCMADIDELLAKPPTDPNVFDKGDGGHVCEAPEIPPLLRTGCAQSSQNGVGSVTVLFNLCLLLVARRTLSKIGKRGAARMNAPSFVVVPSRKEKPP